MCITKKIVLAISVIVLSVGVLAGVLYMTSERLYKDPMKDGTFVFNMSQQEEDYNGCLY